MSHVVMTGATAGLGRVAAQRLLVSGVRLTVGARADGAPDGATALPLDLASLASVRAFAGLVDGPVDVLILNGGGQRQGNRTRTVDGFETTFGTNHLGHYLLLRLLLPRLAAGARVVITSSGTHDPAERTGVTPPRHADAVRLAHPDRDPAAPTATIAAGMHAYSASKLANLMTALSLAERPEALAGGWRVLAYDPGLTPGTGLVRGQPWFVRALVWPLLPMIVPFAKGMNTLADAGRGLFELATTATPPPGRVYAALRKGRLTWPDPSALARDAAARQRLWDDSATLVGL